MNIENYIENVDEKWRDALIKLMETVDTHLPGGFEKVEQYGGIGYVVPFSTYPEGYHVTPDTQLPFLGLAAQKRHLALYHLGIYAKPELLNWFQQEYKKQVPTKLNMGKSCIRFTNTKHIPYELIGELLTKMTPEDWITVYEAQVKK